MPVRAALCGPSSMCLNRAGRTGVSHALQDTHALEIASSRLATIDSPGFRESAGCLPTPCADRYHEHRLMEKNWPVAEKFLASLRAQKGRTSMRNCLHG